MTQTNLLRQVLDQSHRANPYPLYAQMRETPVSIQDDGTYVVSSYAEIRALLQDPRVSSDERNRIRAGETQAYSEKRGHPFFLFLDPPEHDRLRRLVENHFGPPHTPLRVYNMQEQISLTVQRLLDAHRNAHQIDFVDDFAYPLPVTVICELLGVPREDETYFHTWAEALVSLLDPEQVSGDEQGQRIAEARTNIRQYMTTLLMRLREHPGNNLLSALLTENDPAGQLSEQELISTAIVLLIAGHETTVNLLTNSMLVLLRHQDILERVRAEPRSIPALVEEVLRYDPPVQLIMRTTLDDIPIAGTVIPRGVHLVLVAASANRDPLRFHEPDRFDLDRQDNQHFGFGSGIHYCFGAPLARLEVQIALAEIIHQMKTPRLLMGPPPYRENLTLRGPRHLFIEFDGMRE